MELTDKIILTKHHYAPAGTPIERYSISDQPIEVLVANLNRQGIKINPDYSSKSVKYSQQVRDQGSFVEERGVERAVILPLLTQFPEGIQTELIAFYLRDGRGLQLRLRDYGHITKWPGEGMIGGSVAGDFGIQCKLRVEQKILDKTIAEKVKTALKDTYQTELQNALDSLDDQMELFTVVKTK